MFCCVFGFLGALPSSHCQTFPGSICFCFWPLSRDYESVVMRPPFLVSRPLLGNNNSLTAPHCFILVLFFLVHLSSLEFSFSFLFFFLTFVAQPVPLAVYKHMYICMYIYRLYFFLQLVQHCRRCNTLCRSCSAIIPSALVIKKKQKNILQLLRVNQNINQIGKKKARSETCSAERRRRANQAAQLPVIVNSHGFFFFNTAATIDAQHFTTATAPAIIAGIIFLPTLCFLD